MKVTATSKTLSFSSKKDDNRRSYERKKGGKTEKLCIFCSSWLDKESNFNTGNENICLNCREEHTKLKREERKQKYIENRVERIYDGIIRRCTTSTPHGRRYKGRNIKCNFSLTEFEDFYNKFDIENIIKPCVHRIDNDGDYSIDNIIILSASEHSIIHGKYNRVIKKGETLKNKCKNCSRYVCFEIYETCPYCSSKEPSGKKGGEKGKVFSKVLENCLEGKVDVRG